MNLKSDRFLIIVDDTWLQWLILIKLGYANNMLPIQLLQVTAVPGTISQAFFSPLFWYDWLHAISEKLSFAKKSTELWRCQSEFYQSELSFTRFWVLKLMNTSIFSRSHISLVIQRKFSCFHFPKNWVLENFWSEFWLKTEF